MNHKADEEARDTINFEGFDYEVHDVSLNGQNYLRFLFFMNIPFICCHCFDPKI